MCARLGPLEIPRVASWKRRPEAAALDRGAEEEDRCKRQRATLAIGSTLLLFRFRVRATPHGSKHETPDCCLKRPGLRAWVPSSYPSATLTVRSLLPTDRRTTR